MISATINFPKEDIDNIQKMLFRYADHLKGNIPKTVEKTMVKIIVALRAANSTMISGKVRKIVTNPNKYRGGKKSTSRFMRAHDHIQDYYEAHPGAKKTGRKQSWLPKMKDLERGSLPAKLAIMRYTQRRGIKYFQIFGVDKVADAKAHAELLYPKQYNISRRGLARSSWSWILKQLGKSATAEQEEINGAVNVSKQSGATGGYENFSITAHNKLNYIKKATKANVSTALSRASKMMQSEIEGHKKSAAAAVGRIS